MRRRAIALAAGIVVAGLAGGGAGLRSYEMTDATGSNAALPLLLTALNTHDRAKAGIATYRLLRLAPGAARWLRAAAGPLRPRTAAAVSGVADRRLEALAAELSGGEAGPIGSSGYDSLRARFVRTKGAEEGDWLGLLLVLSDAARARRDLARLDADSARWTRARLRIETDGDRSLARGIVRQALARGLGLSGVYVSLAVGHPTLTGRAELDALFRGEARALPVLTPREEGFVRRTFDPPLASPRPRGRRSLAAIERDLDHPLEEVRTEALRDLADADPARAAPRLAGMLRSGLCLEIQQACFDGPREVAPLVEAGRHPDWHARAAVARALFAIGTPEARGALAPLARDPVRFVRIAAAGRWAHGL